MKRKQLAIKHNFAVVLGNKRTQAAEMVLAPGESEGGADNRHRGTEQWLFVVSGKRQARAIVLSEDLNPMQSYGPNRPTRPRAEEAGNFGILARIVQ